MLIEKYYLTFFCIINEGANALKMGTKKHLDKLLFCKEWRINAPNYNSYNLEVTYVRRRAGARFTPSSDKTDV